MENNNVKEAKEVWVLLSFSLGMSVAEGLYTLGVYETHEKAQIALARHYEDFLEDNDEEQVSGVYFIKSTHLCDIVPKSS